MSNKVAIFDGQRLHVWFDDSDIRHDSYESTLFTFFDQPNPTQKENKEKYEINPDISLKMSSLMEKTERNEPFIKVSSQSSLIRRTKDICTMIDITLHPNQAPEIKTEADLIIVKESYVKRVRLKMRPENAPDIYVMSTLSPLMHGWITKLANNYHPLIALKRLIRRMAFDCDKVGDHEGCHRYSNQEKIHTFWFDQHGKFNHRQTTIHGVNDILTLQEAA